MMLDCRTTIVEFFMGLRFNGEKIKDSKTNLPAPASEKNTPKVVKLPL